MDLEQLTGRDKTFVKTTFTRIKEKLAPLRGVAVPAASQMSLPLGAASSFLGGLVAAAFAGPTQGRAGIGSAPRGSSAGSVRGGAGAGTPRVRAAVVGDPFVEELDGQVALVQEVRVDGEGAVELTCSLAVGTSVGREDEPPAGGLLPTLHSWRTPEWTSTSERCAVTAPATVRGNAWQQLLPPEDGVEIPVDFDLPGDELGGVLTLTTLITMTRSGSHPSPAAPRRPGSILWSDEHRVALQGDEALFPIAQADFQDLPHPDRGSWYLEIGEELDAAAMGSLLLLVNERRPLVLDALANASSPSATHQAILSVLRTDILRTLIERALVDDDFDEEEDYPAGSLGATLRHVIRGTFETEDFESLRREREQQPGFFTTRIQAAADMLPGS